MVIICCMMVGGDVLYSYMLHDLWRCSWHGYYMLHDE